MYHEITFLYVCDDEDELTYVRECDNENQNVLLQESMENSGIGNDLDEGTPHLGLYREISVETHGRRDFDTAHVEVHKEVCDIDVDESDSSSAEYRKT